jgi:hypothetical protein
MQAGDSEATSANGIPLGKEQSLNSRLLESGISSLATIKENAELAILDTSTSQSLELASGRISKQDMMRIQVQPQLSKLHNYKDTLTTITTIY